MKTPPLTLVILGLCGVLGLIGVAYFGGDSGKDRTLANLRRQHDSLGHELAQRDRLIAELGASSGDENPLPAAPAPVNPASLASSLDGLNEALGRLEKMATNLEQRIGHSRLAIPTRQKIRARLETTRTALEDQRQSVEKEYRAARQIADQLRVPIDLDSGLALHASLPPILAQNPAFMAARARLAISRGMLDLVEQHYQAALFEWKLR